jgi:transmembrane sensor
MTAPATPPDWDSIARFLAGESTEGEAAAVQAWLAANPADRELVERLNGAATVAMPADVDVESALARVHRAMAEPAERAATTRAIPFAPPVRSRRPVIWIAGLAAAAALAFVAVNRFTGGAAPTGEAHTYATGVGQRDSVRLADGSQVILGPQSRLEVPGDFGRATRTVALTGDGYFDVVHDAAKPFRVRANDALIEDIGTTFTVESDAGGKTSVAVTSGSVRLGAASPGAAPVVLEAGDRGSVDATGQARAQRNAVREEDTSWVRGRLSFRDAPLSRVIAEMERWYGVRIRVADSSLASRHITTSFAGESVDEALRILGLTMGASNERRGDSVVVTSVRGTPKPR